VYNTSSSSYLVQDRGGAGSGAWRCGAGPVFLAVSLPRPNITALLLAGSLAIQGEEGGGAVLQEGQLARAVCVRMGLVAAGAARWQLAGTTLNQSKSGTAGSVVGGMAVMTSRAEFPVTRPLAGRQVECWLGGGQAATAITVEFPPQFTISRQPRFGTPVLEGSRVRLECRVDSQPASLPYWEKDGEKVSEEGDLALDRVTPAHQGWYQCNANHKLGNYSSVGYYLAVRPGDSGELAGLCNLSQPLLLTPHHNISTTVGTTLTIYAKFCSAVRPIVGLWSGPRVLVRQGEVAGRARAGLVASEGNCQTVSLGVEQAGPEDSGQYLLVVSSQAGVQHGRVWVEVEAEREELALAAAGGCDTTYSQAVIASFIFLLLSALI